jgi:hypothetical protein
MPAVFTPPALVVRTVASQTLNSSDVAAEHANSYHAGEMPIVTPQTSASLFEQCAHCALKLGNPIAQHATVSFRCGPATWTMIRFCDSAPHLRQRPHKS